MPRQKPGQSEQNVSTPPILIRAACAKLHIPYFAWDLAASAENAIADCRHRYFDETANALVQDWTRLGKRVDSLGQLSAGSNWNWLNPPFKNIAVWAEKCFTESQRGASTALLVPAATGSNWYNDWVHGYGYVLNLHGRVTFVGHTKPYPKDLILVLYTPTGFNGVEMWDWRKDAQEPNGI